MNPMHKYNEARNRRACEILDALAAGEATVIDKDTIIECEEINPMQEYDWKVMNGFVPIPELKGEIPMMGIDWGNGNHHHYTGTLTSVQIIDDLIGCYNGGSNDFKLLELLPLREVSSLRVEGLLKLRLQHIESEVNKLINNIFVENVALP